MDEACTYANSGKQNYYYQQESYANSRIGQHHTTWTTSSSTWANSFGNDESWTRSPSSPYWHMQGNGTSAAFANSGRYGYSRTESVHQIDTEYYG